MSYSPVTPLGQAFYHLGAGNRATMNNKFQSLNGYPLTRKPTEAERLSGRFLTINRAIQLNLNGKRYEGSIDNKDMIHLLLEAHTSKRIGTPYLLRCLEFIAKNSTDESHALNLISTVKRNVKLRLRLIKRAA